MDHDSQQGKILRSATCSLMCCAALLGPGSSLAAEPLGRLFFTPAERNVLDAGKSLSKPTPALPPPRNVMLNGVVTRSDAERTVWINGKPYHDRSPDGLQVMTNPSSPESTEIRVKGREHAARIKVGQQLNLNAGTVTDQGSNATAEGVPAQDTARRASNPTIGERPGPEAEDKGAKASAPASR